MKQLENIGVSELKTVLKWLKLYSSLVSKIGNRGKNLFHRELEWKNSYRLEYTSSMEENTAWKQGEKAFKKSFGITPSREEVVFIQNDDIEGGIKIFSNDDMVDFSLSMAINQIK